MNQSYQRALNEVSMLKKTLNSQKTSHQNSLQQLETTYKIIEQMKDLLKSQQERNKGLNRQVKQKNDKIQELSREYQDHIMNIKELIERKDMEIKKYTQIKVTDYDMIRLRVINQVEAQHTEELQQLRNEIKRQEFINNQAVYQIQVLKEKNLIYAKQIQELEQQTKFIEEQLSSRHIKQINKVYTCLEQQKIIKRQLQKKLQAQRDRHTQIVKKYHQQLETLQSEISNKGHAKQNNRLYSNLSQNGSMLQLKQSQFQQDNQKLKRQAKQKDSQIQELTKKLKTQSRQAIKQISDLERSLQETKSELKLLRQENKEYSDLQKILAIKARKQVQKKENQLREKYEDLIEDKNKQVRRMQKQVQELRKPLNNQDSKQNGFKSYQQSQELSRSKHEIQQLKGQLKKLNFEIAQNKNKIKHEEFENRQTRAVSVHEVKDKLKAANAQIVTLLKDKISLNEKISRMGLNN